MTPEPPSDRDNDHTYQRPRRTPHPDDTPLDPYNPHSLQREPETRYKRDLLLVAKKIRTTEAQLKSELSKLGKAHRDDLRDVPIDKHREMVQDPMNFPAAKRASTAQSNLDSHYDRWATLCEQHLAEVNAQDTDSGTDSTGE